MARHFHNRPSIRTVTPPLSAGPHWAPPPPRKKVHPLPPNTTSRIDGLANGPPAEPTNFGDVPPVIRVLRWFCVTRPPF